MSDDEVSDALEGDIDAVARRLAAAGDGRRVGAFHLGWWSEQMLEWAFTHPEFKTQLFRFVDVFPQCRDAADVLRHVSEYFDGVPVPRALELGLDVADQVPLGSVVSAAVARRNIRRMARQFIAGEDPHRALVRLRRLWDAGEAITVDLLGERVVSESEAQRYADRVVELVDVLTRRDPRVAGARPPGARPVGCTPTRGRVGEADGVVAAVRVPSRGRKRWTRRWRGCARCSTAPAVGVRRCTSTPSTTKRRTSGTSCCAAWAPSAPDVQLGCVVQAYRKDSFADLRELVAWSATALRVPLRIRLVKGAYWDHEEIVRDRGRMAVAGVREESRDRRELRAVHAVPDRPRR